MEPTQRFLSQHPFFTHLEAAQVERIARLAVWRELRRGEVLALQGEPCQAVYLVAQGQVRAVKLSAEGREQVVNTLMPGEVLYLTPALDGGPLPANAEALTDSVVISLARADLLAILREYPGVALQVLIAFAHRMRHLTSLVEDLSLRTVPQRLARLLAERAQSASEGQPPPRMTQREMAAHLGTVREVVARCLSQFEQQGWITLRRGVIEILDLEALQDAAL